MYCYVFVIIIVPVTFVTSCMLPFTVKIEPIIIIIIIIIIIVI